MLVARPVFAEAVFLLMVAMAVEHTSLSSVAGALPCVIHMFRSFEQAIFQPAVPESLLASLSCLTTACHALANILVRSCCRLVVLEGPFSGPEPGMGSNPTSTS
jgi:hypothetical protein